MSDDGFTTCPECGEEQSPAFSQHVSGCSVMERELRTSVVAANEVASMLDALRAENAALKARVERIEAAARKVIDIELEAGTFRLGDAIGELRAALEEP